MGASLHTLRVLIVCGGRAICDVDASHISPQGLLAAITFVGGGPRDGVARAGAKREAGPPLCSMVVTTLSSRV